MKHARFAVLLTLAVLLAACPQGFTQEDVKRLQGTHVERDWQAFVLSLSNRIAALLPP